MNAVAIDGPAGSGKSTLARRLAETLDFVYIDTGAMYRAVALFAKQEQVNLEDPAAMGGIARRAEISFTPGVSTIHLNGCDVATLIRSPEVTRDSRYAARAPEVREELIRRQRAWANEQTVVMEGRDITTVVLPEARWKFFIHAAPEERARRRVAEMTAAGYAPNYDEILSAIRERDAADRAIGPLKEAEEIARQPTSDIHFIDTTHTDIATAVQQTVELIRPAAQA